MQYVHLGVLQLRIQALHRQEEGTMTLVIFRDNRWLRDQAILATMEVDLTQGSQLVYVIPDIMLTIGDFYRNIQISILTRGYERWQNDEANLLITRGLVDRLSNTPNVRFAYEVQEVDIPTNPKIEGTDHPYLLVHKLSPFAIIPARKTTGAARLDLATSEDCIIQPRGRGLIFTEISMEIPWGTYGRIATRSSAAFRLGLDIGAGVIDCDYRGEIKILAFNHFDQFIHIYRDCVAQLILEYIVILEVYELKNLTLTNRGIEGFGSTTPILQNKSHKKPEARWNTLGEPSGKYDYYVNYAIPNPLPDLELPTPS
ncbi:hypothetical protein ZIOFF_028537 [Zingiber officinale]|uniref:Deoxyuridine 5'-triphosphate nucleotidohydrolase n=1 Tax=Zingiber officinale TaxID=94328 RepID=A0A8J5GN79_ZINOF|nr:hypothetical protein ZIOFF_028537 [Zingiber officinale]